MSIVNGCKMAIVGIGGFGKHHVEVISHLHDKGELKCVAFAEKNLGLVEEQVERLKALGAIHYEDYKEMLSNHPEIEFVVFVTPMALHREMTVEALDRGFHVLTEKPPAVTIQDVRAMIEATERNGKLCGVQFQDTSDDAFLLGIQKLQAGELGNIRKVTGVGMWKRLDNYYDRTGWAGKLKHEGNYVLDGTLHNPFAHLLFNALIIAGNGDPRLATPETVQAELYKGHRIESEDTACLRAMLSNGVELLMYTTLCHVDGAVPYIEVEGTKGTLYWDYNSILKITKADSSVEQFDLRSGEENRGGTVIAMYRNMIAALRDPDVKLHAPIDATLNFILVTNGAFISSGEIFPIEEPHIIRTEEEDSVATYIVDAEKLFAEAARTGRLFSEMNIPWAKKTAPFSLAGFQVFDDKVFPIGS